MPLFDHFGFLAPIYDNVIKPKEPDQLIRILKLPIDGPLLDAGGGTGRVTQTLREYADPLFIVDLSVDMLKKAQEKDGLQVACSHTEKLPFPNVSFERIIMVDALHHVCDHKETADELWRVLKTGGVLVIEELDIREFPIKLVALAEKIALMRSHFISPEKIQSLFPYTNAQVKIEKDGYNAWIIIEKE
jgi:demethylmenaquinone methyltransferase/2-methoxy-6-polyprenyl-1,4-benzoquinol methylase